MGSKERAPLRIAIVGGGIAGVVTALAILARREDGDATLFDVQIYEAAPAFSEFGAGLSVGPNAIRALEMISPKLKDTFHAVVGQLGKQPGTWFDFCIGELGYPSTGINFATIAGPNAGQSLHRADFLENIVLLLPPNVAHFGRTCTAYSQTASGITLSFTTRDGTPLPSVEADFVIAADGIRSVMRRELYKNKGLDVSKQELAYADWVLWRGLVSREKFEKAMGGETNLEKRMHLGRDRHLLYYPIQNDEIFNIVAYERDVARELPEGRTAPWSEYLPSSKLVAGFDGFTPECLALLASIDKPSRWGLFILPELETISDERILLIGDAAHAMAPHCGQGAGSSIEDALFIATLLRDAVTYPRTPKTFSAVVEAYSKVRIPRDAQISSTSWEAGLLAEFATPLGDDVAKVGARIMEAMRALWEWDTVGELTRARTMFKELAEI